MAKARAPNKPLPPNMSWGESNLLVAIGGSAVASVDVGFDLPIGVIPIMAWAHIESAITGAGGATALGIGPVDHVTKYGELTTLTKNTKAYIPMGGFIALDELEDLKVYATNGTGTETGTLQNGSVRVRIVYLEGIDLTDV